MTIQILYVRNVLDCRDKRYFKTLQSYVHGVDSSAHVDSWQELYEFFWPFIKLVGKVVNNDFNSFWILPNGDLYPIVESEHRRTAQLFMDEASGFVHNTASLSQWAVKYSPWADLRLPKNITSNQKNRILLMRSHERYWDFIRMIES